jgi:hypothetical protein
VDAAVIRPRQLLRIAPQRVRSALSGVLGLQSLRLVDFRKMDIPMPEGMAVLEGGVIMPMAGGMHDRNGQPVRESFLQRGPVVEPSLLNWIEFVRGTPRPITVPDPGQCDELRQAIFLPAARFDHFGHMLTETVAWLGPLLPPTAGPTPLADPSTMIVIGHNLPGQDAPGDVAALLGLPRERVLAASALGRPLLIDRVFLPRPSMVIRRGIRPDHCESVRRLVDRRFGVSAEVILPRSISATDLGVNKKVYLSRSRLSADKRRILDEERLEEALRRTGWRIVHPEQESIADQLEIMGSARIIAGTIGSALHLLMYFGAEWAGRAVIGLGMTEPDRRVEVYNYVLQCRMQGIDFRHLCCMRLARHRLRLAPRHSVQNLRFEWPAAAIAHEVEGIAQEVLARG